MEVFIAGNLSMPAIILMINHTPRHINSTLKSNMTCKHHLFSHSSQSVKHYLHSSNRKSSISYSGIDRERNGIFTFQNSLRFWVIKIVQAKWTHFSIQVIFRIIRVKLLNKVNMTMNHFITSKLTNEKGSHTLMFH